MSTATQTTPSPTTEPVEKKDSKLSKVDSPAIGRARESLGDVRHATRELIDSGADVMREGVTKAEHAAGNAMDTAAAYVQKQPLKSLLFAAGAGALLALAASRRYR